LTSERAFPPDRVYLACTLIMAAFVIDLIGFAPGIRVPSAEEVASPVWFTLATILVFGSLTAWLFPDLNTRAVAIFDSLPLYIRPVYTKLRLTEWGWFCALR